MEKNLFYATMMENGQLVIRQCKFTRLIVRPCNIKFSHIDGMAIWANHNFIDYEIAFAGLDFTVKSICDLNQQGIKIYESYEAAKDNNSVGLLVYSYNSSPLIKLNSFQIFYEDVADLFSNVSDVKVYGYGYSGKDLRLQFNSFHWNGTKAIENEIHFRFTLDILNMEGNTCTQGSSGTELGYGKLYNSKEACEKDNAIKVYAFA